MVINCPDRIRLTTFHFLQLYKGHSIRPGCMCCSGPVEQRIHQEFRGVPHSGSQASILSPTIASGLRSVLGMAFVLSVRLAVLAASKNY